ncbi:MAG: hypothetical protein ACRDHD_06765 [Candidatus Limnocylindria bacterium]
MATILMGLAIAAVPSAAMATHSWGGYHWARTSNPFTLQVGDNVSGAWDSVLDTSIADWSQSTVLDLDKAAGGTRPKPCKATSGRVEVCNAKYGNNGWLGLAQIWITGGTHITKGVVKVNDTYYNTPTYNTTAWRNLVMCQEIGHTFGLDHQDEDFDNPNLDTCMDYTSSPGTNQHPNQHDYQMLEQIYAHTDGTTTVGLVTNGRGSAAPANSWGRLVRSSAGGHSSVFELDLGNGQSVVTHVTWAR